MNASLQLLNNFIKTRLPWLGQHDGTQKDIDKACDYPEIITIENYSMMYEREGVATKVVDVWPDECWKVCPSIYEQEKPQYTDFEKGLNNLIKKNNLFSYLHRADKLSGIGRFGIILLGFGDGKQLSEPVEKGKGQSLNYLRAFDESLVQVTQWENDTTNERFGKPTLYSVSFQNVDTGQITAGAPDQRQTKVSKEVKHVHWTRVIHVVDNRADNEIVGKPRMKKVYNRLMDIRKILGSSGEMFWNGGFPGIGIETHPDSDAELDKEGTAKQMEEYRLGLKRWIGVTGSTIKSLEPNISDPTPHIDANINMIALSLDVPMRIFTGTERGELASSQDKKEWNERVGGRQNGYLTPFVIRPLVDHLIWAGVLPEPSKKEYVVIWPDMDLPDQKEKSEVARNKSQAIGAYVQQAGDQLMAPEQFLHYVLGYTEAEAKMIIQQRDKGLLDTFDDGLEDGE